MERCVLHARARARTRRLTCRFVTTRERCAIRDHGDDGSSSERRIHCGARGSGCPVRGGAAEGSGMATGVAGAGRAAARDEGSRKAARKGAGPAGAIKTASLLHTPHHSYAVNCCCRRTRSDISATWPRRRTRRVVSRAQNSRVAGARTRTPRACRLAGATPSGRLAALEQLQLVRPHSRRVRGTRAGGMREAPRMAHPLPLPLPPPTARRRGSRAAAWKAGVMTRSRAC